MEIYAATNYDPATVSSDNPRLAKELGISALFLLNLDNLSYNHLIKLQKRTIMPPQTPYACQPPDAKAGE